MSLYINKKQVVLVVSIVMIAVSATVALTIPVLCPVQEFMTTALFAVGSGGVLGVYGDEMGITFMDKYKAHGAVAVALLVFIFAPASDSRPANCGSRGESEEVSTTEPSRSSSFQAVLVQEADYTLRIVYPLGRSDFEQESLSIQKELEEEHPDWSISVYSTGTWRSAIVNALTSSPPQTVVVASKTSLNSLIKEISQATQWEVRACEDCEVKKANLDAIAYLGISKQ